MPEGHPGQHKKDYEGRAQIKCTQELKPPKYVRSPRNSMCSEKSNMARKQWRAGMERREQKGDGRSGQTIDLGEGGILKPRE